MNIDARPPPLTHLPLEVWVIIGLQFRYVTWYFNMQGFEQSYKMQLQRIWVHHHNQTLSYTPTPLLALAYGYSFVYVFPWSA